MGSNGSVTHWLHRVQAGDEAAAQELWKRYFARLVGLCRRRLADYPRRAQDEEDLALSAFCSFWSGVQKGRFPVLRDRDNLWRILVVVAARKAADYIKHEERQKRGGKPPADHALGRPGDWSGRPLEQIVGNEPTPEFAALVADEYGRLMGRLADQSLCRIAQWKLEGYAHLEIAQRLDCSLRTVERKLWAIRTLWSDEGQGHA